jgi:hypothetical protein
MSHPRQWTTTYSSVFRDRRRYETPDARPSEDSWNVRTQGYYGTRADLSEHATRTAEVEARTAYGSKPITSPSSSQRLNSTQGGAFTTSRAGYSGGLAGDSANVPYGASVSQVKYAHPQKDLWTHPILPHTGIVRDNIPILAGVGGYGVTQRATFPNGYNNGYASELQWADHTEQQQQQQQPEQPHVPQSHVPGYAGFIRGSQFVHGDTFGRTTRNLLAQPTEVPLEP